MCFAKIVPALIIGSTFELAPMSFQCVSIFLFFKVLPQLLAPEDTRANLQFFLPWLQNNCFSKVSWFLLLEKGYWKPKIWMLSMIITVVVSLFSDLKNSFNNLKSKMVIPLWPTSFARNISGRRTGINIQLRMFVAVFLMMRNQKIQNIHQKGRLVRPNFDMVIQWNTTELRY